jgi:hypothetical protein
MAVVAKKNKKLKNKRLYMEDFYNELVLGNEQADYAA